jgi:predicted dehydrogenase
MKRVLFLLVALLPLVSCVQESGIIRTDVPARPAGQQDVLEMAAEPIDTVKVGFIGLGMRGVPAVNRYTKIPGVKIVALCDVEEDRVKKAQKCLEREGLPPAKEYYGSEEVWKKLCEQEDLDLVYVATDWLHHAPIGVYAMEQGKHVAIEVPAAMTLDEIWELIN